MVCLLCIKHHAKCFSRMISFNFYNNHNNAKRWMILPTFTEKKIEAHRGSQIQGMKASDMTPEASLSFQETITRFAQLQGGDFSNHLSHWTLAIHWTYSMYCLSKLAEAQYSHGEIESERPISKLWFYRSIGQVLTQPPGAQGNHEVKNKVFPKNGSSGLLQTPKLNLILSFSFLAPPQVCCLTSLNFQSSYLKCNSNTFLKCNSNNYGALVWIACDSTCKIENLTHSKCSISVSNLLLSSPPHHHYHHLPHTKKVPQVRSPGK